MSRIIATASLTLIAGLLFGAPAPASVTTQGTVVSAQAGVMRLALNPQPEPPGKNKSEKIKKGDPNKPK
jgi:hypothetical protein